jgi:hypothetical protein
MYTDNAYANTKTVPAAMSPAQAYRVLGLTETAGPDAVRAAFRRLAFENHPDRNPGDRECLNRFERISAARHTLENKFRLDRDDPEAGECARCGRYTKLRQAVDRKRYCGQCVMSVGGRVVFLPAPKIVVVGCGFAGACVTVAAACFAMLLLTGRVWCAAATIGFSSIALVSLAITAITVGFAVRTRRRARLLA